MTTCHLIAYADFSLECKVNSYNLVYTGLEFVSAVCTGKHLNINNSTAFTVRHTERCISDFSCLFTEDCTKESFLGCKLCFTLWSYFTDKDIACFNLRTDLNDTVLVKILENIFTYIRNISCNLFGSELCISCLCVIFFNVN